MVVEGGGQMKRQKQKHEQVDSAIGKQVGRSASFVGSAGSNSSKST